MNINYFFRINFPKEIHLHGMAFANGTSRNSFKTKCINASKWRKPSQGYAETSVKAPLDKNETNYLEHILVGDERRSLHQKSIFIPCVYFYATEIMIIPYHVQGFDFPDSSILNASSLRKCIDGAKPLLLKDKDIHIAPELKRYYADCQPSAINFLTMIDMHPSKCLDYSFNDLLQNNSLSFIERYLFDKELDYN